MKKATTLLVAGAIATALIASPQRVEAGSKDHRKVLGFAAAAVGLHALHKNVHKEVHNTIRPGAHPESQHRGSYSTTYRHSFGHHGGSSVSVSYGNARHNNRGHSYTRYTRNSQHGSSYGHSKVQSCGQVIRYLSHCERIVQPRIHGACAYLQTYDSCNGWVTVRKHHSIW